MEANDEKGSLSLFFLYVSLSYLMSFVQSRRGALVLCWVVPPEQARCSGILSSYWLSQLPEFHCTVDDIEEEKQFHLFP